MDQNQNVQEKENSIDWKLIIAASLGALGMVWFNASFVLSVALFIANALAIFLLAFGGWYSVLLVCRPRRIVSHEQQANETTWQEFMAEMCQYNPFMRDFHAQDSASEQKIITSWDLRKGFLSESSACLVWLLAVVFLTLTADRYMPLYIITVFTAVLLSVSWIKYLLLYDRWRAINEQTAKNEHYGLWILERMQYGFLLLYCVDFASYKVGLL